MNTCRAAYIELRWISSICNFLLVDFLLVDATKTLMCSLVLLKLDYCNSLLSDSAQYLIQLFQKVQNTAAWITLKAPRVEHTSSLLCSLHWLPVQKRIMHKICSICYFLHWLAKYLSELVNVYTPSRCLCSLSDSNTLTIPVWKPRPVGSIVLLIKDQLHGTTFFTIQLRL